MKAVFVEVVEPERLVFREPDIDMTSTSTFTDLGDGRTRVVIHQSIFIFYRYNYISIRRYLFVGKSCVF